jgi:hypothetical protein
MAEVNFLVKKGLTVPKGSASTPSVIFDASDPNTGLYSPGADQVAVATNGSGRLFVDASGNINLGQASSALQSGGTGLTVYGASASEIKFLNSTTGATDTDGTALVTSGNTFSINNREAGSVIVGTSNTERLRITDAGLVGIGTSSPSYKLHVVTDAISGRQDPTNISRTSGNLIRFTNPQFSTDASMGLLLRVFPDADSRQGAGIIANGGTNNGSTTLDLFYTDTAGTSKSGLRISDTGAVGIGTTSPLSPLAVSNGSNKNIEFQPGSTCYLLAYDRTASDYLDLDITAENLIFSTNNGTERARIDSSGRLLVGTTSAQGSAILQTDSTTLGFLPPRMTTAQRDAISSPAAGLMVYNTSTNKLNFYNGTAWEAVTSA